MEYIKRDLERRFLHMSTAFKAVMVVGRQVGKSTMLKHLAKIKIVLMLQWMIRNFVHLRKPIRNFLCKPIRRRSASMRYKRRRNFLKRSRFFAIKAPQSLFPYLKVQNASSVPAL